MRIVISALVLLAPTLAFGQVHIDIGLPRVRFEIAPPVVVVTPGVQVVEEMDEEVFVVDGHYWCRRDGYWFRSRDHRGQWVYMEDRHVPRRLVSIPRGKYRHYKHMKRHEKERRKHHRHDDDHHDHDRHHDHGRDRHDHHRGHRHHD